MKLKFGKGKSVKNQFVLSVGDEGAIFSYFEKGRLANKLYADSPQSHDIKLIEKLMATYPKTPVAVLVDVIEQNYSQQVLPPVSSFGIRQQVQRRVKRDLQANDFNNVLLLNRAKEGRKEWNFLFISLANSDPFAKWLEVILNQNNPFAGVYLLPLESTTLQAALNKSALNSKVTEWELLVLHNKVGGFRIIAFKEGKLIFTRLAQNLVGDNIPDIIVGNMEQEISNTVEYLKRMAFKNEAESKITIIAGAEILQKVDAKNLKFGSVDLLTPYQVSEKLDLPKAVTDKDKFADILIATHFAASKSHVLKFNSPYTKKLEQVYTAIKASYIIFALVLISLIGLTGSEIYDIGQQNKEKQSKENQKISTENKRNNLAAQKKNLPGDLDKMLEIKAIVNMLPEDKFRSLRVINDIAPFFDGKRKVKSLSFTASRSDKATDKKAANHFQIDVDMDFTIPSHDQDLLNTISENFLKEMNKRLSKLPPKYVVTYATKPQMVQQSSFEQVISSSSSNRNDDITIPAKLSISGDF